MIKMFIKTSESESDEMLHPGKVQFWHCLTGDGGEEGGNKEFGVDKCYAMKDGQWF